MLFAKEQTPQGCAVFRRAQPRNSRSQSHLRVAFLMAEVSHMNRHCEAACGCGNPVQQYSLIIRLDHHVFARGDV